MKYFDSKDFILVVDLNLVIKMISRKIYLLLFFIAAALEAYPLQQTFRRYSLPSFVKLPNRLGRYLDHPPSLGLQDAATVSPQPLYKESLEKHKQKDHKNLKMSSLSEEPEITLEELEKLLENDDENLEMSPLNEESEFTLEGLENLSSNDNVNNTIFPLIKEPEITLEELEKLVENDDLNHGMYSLSEGPEIVFEQFEKHMEKESEKSEISTLIEDSEIPLEWSNMDENLITTDLIEELEVPTEDLEEYMEKNLKTSTLNESEITLNEFEKQMVTEQEDNKISTLAEDSEFTFEKGIEDENLITADLIEELEVSLEDSEEYMEKDQENLKTSTLKYLEILLDKLEEQIVTDQENLKISTLPEDSEITFEIGIEDENLITAGLKEEFEVPLEDSEEYMKKDQENLKTSTLNESEITLDEFEKQTVIDQENVKISTLAEDSEITFEIGIEDENLITADLIEELEVPMEDSEEYMEKDQENLKTFTLNDLEITMDEFEKQMVTDQVNLKISTLAKDSEITFEKGIEYENLTAADLIEELRLQITLENLKEQKETNQKTLNTSTLNKESEITLEEFKEHLDKDQDNLQTSSRYDESMTSLEKHLKKDHKLEESETQVKKDDDDDDTLSGESKIITKVSEMNIYNVDEMTSVLIDELEVPWEISENPLDTEDENTKTQYLIKDSEIMLEELKKKFETLPVMEDLEIKLNEKPKEHLNTQISAQIKELENTLNALEKHFENYYENFTPPTLRRELKITVEKSTESSDQISNMKTSTDEKMLFSVLLSVFDT